MRFQCDECRQTMRGRPHVTATGRRLCEECNNRLLGATAGVMAGGGVGGAIATSGIFTALKRWRNTPNREGGSPGSIT
jgi:hypothetical protein